MTGAIVKEDLYRKEIEQHEVKDLIAIRQNIREHAGALRALIMDNRLNVAAEQGNIKTKVGHLINVLVPVAELVRTQWVIEQLKPVYEHPNAFRQQELADHLYKPLAEIQRLLELIDRRIELLNAAVAA